MGVLSCESYVQSCDFNRDGDHVITGEFNGHVKVITSSTLFAATYAGYIMSYVIHIIIC